MSDAIDDAVAALSAAFLANLDHDTGGPTEACREVNDASRAVAWAMADRNGGSAWIVAVNAAPGEIPLREYRTSDRIPNFFGDYAIPAYDDTLARLVLERIGGPYTGTKDDAARLDAIRARVESIGGHCLIWS